MNNLTLLLPSSTWATADAPSLSGQHHYSSHHTVAFGSAFSENHSICLPLYQSEAMWMNFTFGVDDVAVKILAGSVNVITGLEDEPGVLTVNPQNYIVRQQPWLDGVMVAGGSVRQFVAGAFEDGIEGQLLKKGLIAKATGGLSFEVFRAYPTVNAVWSAKHMRFFEPTELKINRTVCPLGILVWISHQHQDSDGKDLYVECKPE
ncbi:hypothetical protein BJ741DRAFT_637954 [Chytriomyces cf. hyalinus JEL632]|nr:hypothetical protein BJ741DRAFT_637954 [Chytriomyces cf. hyalinus JEL632]